MAAGLVVWVGAALVLSSTRWFARAPLVERLRPFGSAPGAAASRPGLLSVESFRDVLRPAAAALGELLGRLTGGEDLATRLTRIHSPVDASAFRVRQVGRAGAGLLMGVAATAALRPPAPIAGLLILGLPALAFLLTEHALQRASTDRQRRLAAELPVIAEQLAMLLASGWSTGGALQRVAERGTGVTAGDLRVVVGRVRQGLGQEAALREWRDIADVRAVDRLVAVLALQRATTDLGRLLADEAKAIRQDHHRRLIEQLETREQQVWIPVTVATLVPGAIFLSIPFIEALRLFTGS
ncbi:MAG: type II secretion system F family protein [Acidimicrobiales bacterium]